MRLERIEEKPLSYTGVCPDCGQKNVTYIHDLKCVICDNKTVVFCPRCETHFKVIPE
jgi:hypothetical protein